MGPFPLPQPEAIEMDKCGVCSLTFSCRSYSGNPGEGPSLQDIIPGKENKACCVQHESGWSQVHAELWQDGASRKHCPHQLRIGLCEWRSEQLLPLFALSCRTLIPATNSQQCKHQEQDCYSDSSHLNMTLFL